MEEFEKEKLEEEKLFSNEVLEDDFELKEDLENLPI